MKTDKELYWYEFRENGLLSVTMPGRYSDNDNLWMASLDCKEYMHRGNKVYFRGVGENKDKIKIIITKPIR